MKQQIRKLVVTYLLIMVTLSAASAWASACIDLWSDVKVIQALDDLAAMRMNLDLKMVEDPNSLVYGQLDLEFKKKEAEFIKELGITKNQLKEKIQDKIKGLQEKQYIGVVHEARRAEEADALLKEQALELREYRINGFRIEEKEHEMIGTLYRITNAETGQATSRLWAKEAFPQQTFSNLISNERVVAYQNIDPNDPNLIHPDAEARRWCLKLGGDLPTKKDWEELWEIVGKKPEVLNQIFPGIQNKFWWSSSVHETYTSSVNETKFKAACLFYADHGRTHYGNRALNMGVRCVLR